MDLVRSLDFLAEPEPVKKIGSDIASGLVISGIRPDIKFRFKLRPEIKSWIASLAMEEIYIPIRDYTDLLHLASEYVCPKSVTGKGTPQKKNFSTIGPTTKAFPSLVLIGTWPGWISSG